MEQEILFKILIDSVVDRAIFMGGNGMFIRKVKIHNFKCYRDIEIALEEGLNIIIGDNEAGKSTILEAINLALTGIISGKSIWNCIYRPDRAHCTAL